MKRLIILVAIVGSAFIFTSCATDNGEQASSNPQVSPFAPPNNAIMDDTGFNRWPLTFTYDYSPGTESEQPRQ